MRKKVQKLSKNITGRHFHAEGAVGDWLAGKEDIDRVQANGSRHILAAPLIGAGLSDFHRHCVFLACRIQNYHLWHSSSGAWI